MSHLSDYTPLSEIPTIYEDLQKTFRTGLTKPIAWRRRQLLQLARFAKENADALANAIRLDLGKHKQEVILAEVHPIIERSLICADQIEEWARPEPVTVQAWQQSWNPRIEKHPKGVVLIIAPWNYPMILSLQPLYGAIAAGCCALIKSSEISPHYSSFLAKNLNKYLDPSAFRVALGGVPEITRILELKFDSTADISISAKRILYGKINNSGQICVAPDYILAERSIVDALVESLKEHYRSFYPEGALKSDDYGFIVSDYHFERLKGLLKRTKGKIVLGGKWDEEPGKRGELFGPILPIITVDSVDDAIAYLNDHDHPLVLYIFSSDENNKKRVSQIILYFFIANTFSGGVSMNDTFAQLSMNEVPFGGVGESGHGRQVLRASFDNFTYTRGVSDTPYGDEPAFAARYPPYTQESYEIFAAILNTHIPEE
ncbi:aldehyde dehydrogenase [Gymnopilus junonius]|uniref:Aldehyde dehydrogenase n=1 Tax=Gymnopilus junonius TaxID=109634 RepID=A0A9P5NFT8_GYMJU|nr:aldehyde dehydrogenase [Gymnopilus junonius]